jgi:hypothetical protein
MKVFCEEKNGKQGETMVVIDLDESAIIYDALEEYCKNNKRKLNAKKM